MSIIIKPEIRKTSELPFHSDAAPGKRFVFIEKSLYLKSEFYIMGRRVEIVPENQPEYIEKHRHNCNSFYVFVGDNEDLSGLDARVNIEDKEFVVQSPSTVMIPQYNLHYYKLTKGKGWFFHINLVGDYKKSLADDKTIDLSKIQISQIDDIYKKSEKQLKKAASSERPLTSSTDKILNPQRWIFINPTLFRRAGIYSAIHQIFSDKPYDYEMKLHRHITDEVYLLFGKNGGELEINIFDGKKKIRVKSPATIYHQANLNHRYEHIKGEGFILIVLKENILGEGYKFIPVS